MPSAHLLLTLLYLIPAVAIFWHNLSERLPTYHAKERIEYINSNFEDNQFENKRTAFLSLETFVGFVCSHTAWTIKTTFIMSTRYWDEIDWYIQEGTQKLCEMLHDENEDASSSNWSKGEEEDDIYKETKEENKKKENEEKTDEIVNKVDNISMKDEASSSDGDSVKDDEEYMERSTSVEDEKTAIIKKQTKVDELISLCQKCNMLPPIYTYFTTGDEQVVSTVQLWNGVRFSSHPQITRDKAMEEAAGQAIGYLKTEQRDNRPVSTSPPSTLPYYFPVQSLVQPQYYQTHPAYAPVSYSTVPPQTYFLPSVPYAMVQQPVVSTIPTEFQQQSAMMQHHYRIDAPGQYNPYFQQYPPLVRVQVSPTHRAKSASPVYHSAAVGKGMWANQYQIRDKANMSRKTTEYKLLDEPPTSAHPSSQLKEEQKEQHKSSTTENKVEHLDSKESSTKKSTTAALPKKQNTAKPKLAISFNKAQTRE